MDKLSGSNADNVGITFTDTGEEWSLDDIIAYQGSNQRAGDLVNTIGSLRWASAGINVTSDMMFIDGMNRTLKEKKNIIIELPPYATHSGQWEKIHTSIETLIRRESGDVSTQKEVALCIHGKWQIMLAREKFLEDSSSAIQKQGNVFVTGADWNEEKIEEYKESSNFGLDYTFLTSLHLKVKTNIEFNKNLDETIILDLGKLLEDNFNKLMQMPVYALDTSFSWKSLYFICCQLSELLPKEERMIVDSLISQFKKNGKFQSNFNEKQNKKLPIITGDNKKKFTDGSIPSIDDLGEEVGDIDFDDTPPVGVTRFGIEASTDDIMRQINTRIM